MTQYDSFNIEYERVAGAGSGRKDNRYHYFRKHRQRYFEIEFRRIGILETAVDDFISFGRSNR